MTDKPKRQYVSVIFRPGDSQRYTYHNDGRAVVSGDRVSVPSKRGPQNVTVAVDYAVPNLDFETKAILGRVGDVPDPRAAPPGDLFNTPEKGSI